MNYYQKHLFFCVNERAEGKKCCQDAGAKAMCEYAKARIKSLGLSGKGRVRVNMAGCLGRCEEGPVIVIYPEGVWYTYQTIADIDEILTEHVVNGRIVDRLRLSTSSIL